MINIDIVKNVFSMCIKEVIYFFFFCDRYDQFIFCYMLYCILFLYYECYYFEYFCFFF